MLVTGPSGCGKSTLTKIIQGMYLQTASTVRLDGRGIRSMPVNELRLYLGVVPQGSVLFSGSILENLLEASPQASFAQVVEACKLAGIHETVRILSKSLTGLFISHAETPALTSAREVAISSTSPVAR